MPNSKVRGLDAFGLALGDLRRLRDRVCHLSVNFKTYEIVPALLRVAPARRHEYLRARVEKWVAGLRRLPGGDGLKLEPNGSLPLSAAGPARVSDIAALSALRGVDYVFISKIRGLRRSPTATRRMSWYCVRGNVALQVEGQKTGMQVVEDRFVVTRATSFEHAVRRLRTEWASYSRPYLNPEGRLVRWQLEHIKDVYLIDDLEQLPDPTEVYSRLSSRRMKQEYVWIPERK